MEKIGLPQQAMIQLAEMLSYVQEANKINTLSAKEIKEQKKERQQF